MEQQSVSNDLHDALIQKSTNCFWKSWHNKFGKKKVTPKSVEGLVDEQLIANEFAEYFCVNGNTESTADRILLENTFMERLANYRNDADVGNLQIDVELVDCVISKLKKGKASGADHLSSEHFLYCHPIVISILAMLFNLMIKYEFVPDFFGLGILIPIPKNDANSNFDKCSDYRGICVSSIISKFF